MIPATFTPCQELTVASASGYNDGPPTTIPDLWQVFASRPFPTSVASDSRPFPSPALVYCPPSRSVGVPNQSALERPIMS